MKKSKWEMVSCPEQRRLNGTALETVILNTVYKSLLLVKRNANPFGGPQAAGPIRLWCCHPTECGGPPALPCEERKGNLAHLPFLSIPSPSPDQSRDAPPSSHLSQWQSSQFLHNWRALSALAHRPLVIFFRATLMHFMASNTHT